MVNIEIRIIGSGDLNGIIESLQQLNEDLNGIIESLQQLNEELSEYKNVPFSTFEDENICAEISEIK